MREHSGLCDRTNFQKDTFESVQITFQNSRTLKTEFLEPPLNNKYLTLRLGSQQLGISNSSDPKRKVKYLLFKGGSNNSEIGIGALSEVFFLKV